MYKFLSAQCFLKLFQIKLIQISKFFFKKLVLCELIDAIPALSVQYKLQKKWPPEKQDCSHISLN